MAFLEDTNFWVALSFILFLLVAYRYGKDAMIGTLDARIEKIRADIETAENLRVEAQELLDQYQRKAKDALSESEELMDSAQRQAEEIRRNLDIETEEVIKLKEHQLEERLKRLEEQAISDIRFQVTDIATQATMQIIAEKLGKKENASLIEKSIQTLPSKMKH